MCAARSSLKKSDFSIARILANDQIRKSDTQFKCQEFPHFTNFTKSHQLINNSIFENPLKFCGSHENFRKCVGSSETRIETKGSTDLNSCDASINEKIDEKVVSYPTGEIRVNAKTVESNGADQVEKFPEMRQNSKENSTVSLVEFTNHLERMKSVNLKWLHYTRYRPPKLPRRNLIGKLVRRKTGNHPRIPFSSFQLQILEEKYRKSAYLSRRDVVEMANSLRIPQSRVKIWFQNRRARARRETHFDATTQD